MGWPGSHVRRAGLAGMLLALPLLAGPSIGAQAGPLHGPIVQLPSAARPDSNALPVLRRAALLLDSIPASDRVRMGVAVVEAMLALKYPDAARTLASSGRLAFPATQFRELSCQLIEARRWDDAVNASTELLEPTGAAWALGHIAQQLVDAPRALAPATASADDTVALRKRAIALARSISLPDARVDALLAVAYVVEESRLSADSATAFWLYRDAAAAVGRIGNVDRRGTRSTMIAINLAHYDAAAATRMLPHIQQRVDWWMLALSLAPTHPRDSAGVRLRARAIAEARKRMPPGAEYRQHILPQFVTALRKGGDSAAANEVEAELRRLPWAFRPERAVRSEYERAINAAEIGDTAAATRAAARVRDTDRSGRRASVWNAMAANYNIAIDVRRAWLLRGRNAALAASVDSATRDFLLGDVASSQFWAGLNDDALETLALVRSDEDRRSRFYNFGASTFSDLDGPRPVRALADRAPDRVLRDLVLGYLVSKWLTGHQASDSDNAWGEALVDSIADPESKRRAGLAVAERALQRRDSTRARAILLRLANRMPEFTEGAAGLLVRAGGTAALLDWARSRETPEKRIAALLVAAKAMDAERGRPRFFSNGPDHCRHPF